MSVFGHSQPTTRKPPMKDQIIWSIHGPTRFSSAVVRDVNCSWKKLAGMKDLMSSFLDPRARTPANLFRWLTGLRTCFDNRAHALAIGVDNSLRR